MGTAAEVGREAREVVDGRGMLLMPGLVNTHCHAADSLFRGLIEDLPLEPWLKLVWKAEGAILTPETVRLGATLGLAELLLAGSEEFGRVWGDHEVGLRPPDVKHFIHPELGVLELTCQALVDPDQSHNLLVYTAVPGSESHEKLQLLSVIGTQTLL